MPDGLELDGYDQSIFVSGKIEEGRRETFYYHQKNVLRAVRKDKWKLMILMGVWPPNQCFLTLKKIFRKAPIFSPCTRKWLKN